MVFVLNESKRRFFYQTASGMFLNASILRFYYLTFFIKHQTTCHLIVIGSNNINPDTLHNYGVWILTVRIIMKELFCLQQVLNICLWFILSIGKNFIVALCVSWLYYLIFQPNKYIHKYITSVFPKGVEERTKPFIDKTCHS